MVTKKTQYNPVPVIIKSTQLPISKTKELNEVSYFNEQNIIKEFKFINTTNHYLLPGNIKLSLFVELYCLKAQNQDHIINNFIQFEQVLNNTSSLIISTHMVNILIKHVWMEGYCLDFNNVQLINYLKNYFQLSSIEDINVNLNVIYIDEEYLIENQIFLKHLEKTKYFGNTGKNVFRKKFCLKNKFIDKGPILDIILNYYNFLMFLEKNQVKKNQLIINKIKILIFERQNYYINFEDPSVESNLYEFMKSNKLVE